MTFTIYNWQFSDLNECLAYPINSHIWNSFRCDDNNRKSAVFYCHFIITNTGSSQVYVKTRLISNIENDIITL